MVVVRCVRCSFAESEHGPVSGGVDQEEGKEP